MTEPRLIIGGPYNGERRNWSGDLVSYPDNVSYRLKTVVLNKAQIDFYIFEELSDEEALKLLQENYLGI